MNFLYPFKALAKAISDQHVKLRWYPVFGILFLVLIIISPILFVIDVYEEFFSKKQKGDD